MIKLKNIVARQEIPEEKALKKILSTNIKKYRQRRNWSQFALAAKINISTNFLADIEAGNTWVSAQTLIKLSQAFDIEAFELIKPENAVIDGKNLQENEKKKAELSNFSQDLTVVLQESLEKALEHVKKQYDIS